MIFLIFGLPKGISEKVSEIANRRINGHVLREYSIEASQGKLEEHEHQYALRIAD